MSRSTPGSGTTYPINRSPVVPSPCTVTTARATPAQATRADSISPSSIRNPRTLTCRSHRPTYSRVRPPSGSRDHRTRSPVRYIRCPGPANGSATNRDAVKPIRLRYPRARPGPAKYNSPTTPTGTGRNHASSTTCRTPRIGPPIVTGSPTLIAAPAFDWIVASAGPYVLNIRRPGAHRATSSGGHASPPTTTVPRSSSPAGSTVPNAVGVSATWVTLSRNRICANSLPAVDGRRCNHQPPTRRERPQQLEHGRIKTR